MKRGTTKMAARRKSRKKAKVKEKKIIPKERQKLRDSVVTEATGRLSTSFDSSMVNSGCRMRVVFDSRPDHVVIYEPDELDSGEEENAKDLKNLKDVIRIYGEEVDFAKAHLQIFLSQVYAPELSMSPYKSFVMRQASLAAFSIAARMKSNRLQYLDIRDHLENLASLFDFMQIRNKEACGYLSMLLSRFIGFIGPIAEVLEDLAGKHVTDWNRLEEFYMVRYEDLELECQEHQEMLRVPFLSEFIHPRLCAVGNSSSGFSVWYGSSVEMFMKTAHRKRIVDARVERCSRNRKLLTNCTQIGCMAKHLLIAQVYSCFLSTSHYMIVMEHVDGVTLHELVQSSTTLTAKVSAIIFAQICLAVEYLHYVGFIHRNICADNIMVTKMCRVRMIDFASLKMCSGMYCVRMLHTYRKRTTKEFNDREVVGPLHFRAPELLRRHPYGRAIDWWAVGVVAFLMKFGYVPFRGNTEAELMTEILSGNIQASLESCRSSEEREDASKPGELQTTGHLYNNLIQRLLKVRVNRGYCSSRYLQGILHNTYLILSLGYCTPSKVRLNSKTYEDYRRHDLFEQLNWESLERAEEILLVPRVSEILEKPAEKGAVESTDNTAICTDFGTLKDCSKQFALYTFNSTAFLRVQDAFYNGETVKAEMLHERVELIGTFSDNGPYKFQEWYKSTRL